MSGPFGSSQWGYASGEAAAAEGQSLRFNDDDSAYLEWTPSSAGDQQTQTISFWVKRANLGTLQYIFSADATSGGRYSIIRFNTADQLEVYSGNFDSGTQIIQLLTTQVFRDVSAWYHIVVAIDITNATSSDRARVYVNGERVTSFSGTITYPATTDEVYYSSTRTHWIGQSGVSSYYCDLYLSEFNFIDGTALDPTSFAETDANGQWVPIKEPSVTYGTNGFYLPFTNDYEVEGFNTVTYKGNGGTQYVGGVGFEPDFLWIKVRSTTNSHYLFDQIRGADQALFSDGTSVETDYSSTGRMTSFDTDGFTVKYSSSTGTNASSHTYVAWAWDMGTGSAASNTDGSITSSVKASQTYGQSIVSYTGTGSNATVGHGLSSAPDMVIVKQRNAVRSWIVYHSANTANPETDYLELNTTAATSDLNTIWNDTAPTSDVFSVGTATSTNGSTNTYIAYCFHSVAGYSSFGSYTGNGSSTGPTVTTGFKPAFVMIKRTDSTSDWKMYDTTRNPSGVLSNLEPNTTNAEDETYNLINVAASGFVPATSDAHINASGGNYIYMAFADKREAAFWLDQSGNNNDWTNNNMQESDISLDSPTNNFATLNPLSIASGETQVLEEGNLNCTNSSSNYGSVATTIGASSGKWYCEGVILSSSAIGSSRTGGGVLRYDDPRSSYIGAAATGWGYGSGGVLYNLGNTVTGVSTLAVGDIFMLAIDIDNGKMWIGKNGTWESSGDPAAGTGAQSTNLTGAGEYFFGAWSYTTTDNTTMNFGQDSSFAGNKVAQGNVDENGFGDFYYEPPAGYLALCTQNLPDPAIADGSEHFNTVLYTGNGSTNAITGVGFQPDFVWTKPRSFSDFHQAFDLVRGTGKNLSINQAVAEQTQSGSLSSFDSDGFTIGSWSNLNSSGSSFVAWNWKADNTSGSSNTDGTITSTVSANTTAGFSIVSYSGTRTSAGNDTIGHGLGVAPSVVISKSRNTTGRWVFQHVSLGSDDYLELNTTAAAADSVSVGAGSLPKPTSSVFYASYLYGLNVSGENNIAYCFAEVEGYSKFGSYTGNGSTNGPVVYTGFKPAFIMIKRTDSTGDWWMYDAARNPYNIVNYGLRANASNAEVSDVGVDILSNGWKYYDQYAPNYSGGTYIYMAFAENPFKYSNAR